jgi:hypothetical protein
MLLGAPKFADKTGYLPFIDLTYLFRQLTEGFGNIRPEIGDERYMNLIQMFDQMQALLEADPEDRTGETAQGCRIIHAMEDILRQVPRKR